MSPLLRLPPWMATLVAALLLAALLAAGAALLRPVLVPVIAAAMLYVLLAPAVDALQRRGLGRSGAIALVLGTTTVSLTWAAATQAPELGRQLHAFAQRLPTMGERLQTLAAELDRILHAHLGLGLPTSEVLSALRGQADRLLGQWLAHGSGMAAEILLWLALAPLITFFALRDYRRLRNAFLSHLPNSVFEDILRMVHRVGSQLERYVRGVVIQSSVIALVVGGGLALLGLPLAPLLGLVAGLLNLIPYLGPLLGVLPPLLVGLSMGLDGPQLGGILAVFALAQLIDNLIVVPTVLARAADLHPLAALLGVIIGGQLGGPLGMILALPLLASARIALSGIHEALVRRRIQVARAHADMAGTENPVHPSERSETP